MGRSAGVKVHKTPAAPCAFCRANDAPALIVCTGVLRERLLFAYEAKKKSVQV